jgi:hypothetical protein
VSGIVGTENIITFQNSGLSENYLFQDRKIVVNTILTNPEKVYIPLLHIKLGFIKNVLKAMDQHSAGFIYLKNKFPRISDAEIKEGVFVGCQIRELIQDVKLEGQLNELEKQHGNHSKYHYQLFWEIILQKHCCDMVADLVQSYKVMGCYMSLKVHFLDSHLDFFPENLGQ